MDKVILGKGVVLEDDPGRSRPNNNQIIVGGTGTGKSVSVLWPTMCYMRESSFMGTFAKSGEVDKAIPFFKGLGYREIVWNLAEPGQGDPLPDPLSYITCDDDLQQIAKAIAESNPKYRSATNYDPYWQDAAEGLLTGLIHYVFLTETAPSMNKVLDLFYSMKIKEDGKGIATTLDDKFDLLEGAGGKFPSHKKDQCVQTAAVRYCGVRQGYAGKGSAEYVPGIDPESDEPEGIRGFRKICFRTYGNIYYHKSGKNNAVQLRKSVVRHCDTKADGICRKMQG